MSIQIGPESYKTYRCRDCGHIRLIRNNHWMPCAEHCSGCSHDPSFGTNGIPFDDQIYRVFDCVES